MTCCERLPFTPVRYLHIVSCSRRSGVLSMAKRPSICVRVWSSYAANWKKIPPGRAT